MGIKNLHQFLRKKSSVFAFNKWLGTLLWNWYRIMKIKTSLVILLSIVLTSCQNTANWSTIDFLHGEWEGTEITNYIKIAGFPGALTPHSIAHLTNTIDSLHKTSTIDSLGTTID